MKNVLQVICKYFKVKFTLKLPFTFNKQSFLNNLKFYKNANTPLYKMR